MQRHRACDRLWRLRAALPSASGAFLCEGLGLGVIFACPGPGPDIRGGPGGRDTRGRPPSYEAGVACMAAPLRRVGRLHGPPPDAPQRPEAGSDRSGDPRLINYLLEHTYRVLALKPGYTSCWEMPFFFPHRNVGAYTDVILTVSPPYLLFRLLGFEPDTAFQLWMMSVTALNFLAFYLFLRRCLWVGAPAASLGAALFAAGSSRVQQVGHLQLLCVAFVVLALAALSRLLAEDASDAGTPNPLGEGRRCCGFRCCSRQPSRSVTPASTMPFSSPSRLPSRSSCCRSFRT